MPQVHLLLVEDEAELAALIERKLRAAGIEVVWAPDAETAMEALRGGVFDAVWSDWNLGGTLTGAHVLRAADTLMPQALLFLVSGAHLPSSLPSRTVVLDKKDLPRALRVVIEQLISR